jgi:hypothetical protein
VDVVVAQADVLDLVEVAEVDQADVAAVQADALLPALADAEDVMDVEEHALENVVPHVRGHVEVDAQVDAEDVVGVRDAEAHVQAHARQVEKARLVLHAIAAPDALVRVLRVLRVADVVDAMDVVDVAAVHPVVTAVVAVREDVMVAVVADVQEDVQDVQEDAAGARDAVLDVTARALEIATDVVMAVVDNVKTHVLLPAQQRVQVPAKLKHLVP